MDRFAQVAHQRLAQWKQQTLDRTTAVVIAAYLVLYVLLDWLSYVQPVLKLGITPWNPQAGLTLAFLLLYGPRGISLTASAALLAEVIVRGNSGFSPAVLGGSLWIAIGYGALAAVLKKQKLDQPIRTPSHAVRIAAAAVVGTAVVAAGYVLIFTAAGSLPWSAAVGNVVRYSVGDVNGILTLTPLLLYAREWRSGTAALKGRGWEVFGQCASILLSLWVVLGVSATDELRFFYLLFVPIIWIALRWGVPGAMLAVLSTQMGLVIAAQDVARAPTLVDLHFLVVTLSLTALLLGAVVTERASVLQRIVVREAEQRALLATVPDAVLVVESSDRVHGANPAAARLFGAQASEENRSRSGDILPGVAFEGPEGRASLDARRPDGSSFPAEIAWARLDSPGDERVLMTVRDVTDRRNAEAQLRERDAALARAMRFAVAGELASTLAHELNQPITAVVSYLRALGIMAKPFAEQEERIGSTLGKATHEAIRASRVLRRLKDFYRGGTLKLEEIQLAALCGSVAVAFQERLRQMNASLSTHVDESLPPIVGDPTQLEMVLHNLLANAIDAVAEIDKPWRRVELSAARSDGDVLLVVEDSGGGVKSDVAPNLFEPFVTSKSDGMGLGLAISRSLIRARGGDLTLRGKSRLGGAAFVVRLPIEPPQDMPR